MMEVLYLPLLSLGFMLHLSDRETLDVARLLSILQNQCVL